MGQALRRASGRVRATRPETPAAARPAEVKRAAERPTPEAAQTGGAAAQDRINISDSEVASAAKDDERLLEERDLKYDDMLKQMAGRITSKPGGKLEMGEAFIVEQYNRPMPKLRSTKEDGHGEQRPLPPGTLNVEQVHQIILLYQGKSDDHRGKMDINHIAEKFRVDAAQVQKIVQFVSLHQEDSIKKAEN
ncbi:uncharacterized protein [Typha angustifolia]|uniref:uncharacterized protein n=1 Tax=Typha angustifolia TaxID=59011 RepID=UPI003C2C022B